MRKCDGVKQVKRFISKIVLVALAASLAVPVEAYSYNGFGTKSSSNKEEIAKGVTLIKEHYTSGTQQRAVNIMDVQYRNSNVDLELYHPNPYGRILSTSQQAINNTYQGHYVVGAVNASFYNMQTGMPVNLLVKGNEILNYGILSADANRPVHYPFAVGVNRNGALTMTEFNTSMTYTVGGQKLELSAVNADRVNGSSVIYTGSHREATTGASQFVTELVVTNTNQTNSGFSFGDKITGTVSEIRRLGEGGNAVIPKNGFVISANGGALRDKLANVKVGDTITAEATINDAWRDAEFVMATGPTLVRDGKVNISMNTSSSHALERAPRTAIGVSSDGSKLFLVTIDGRQPGFSEGATIPQLAEYMRSLGAQHAITLDGGGSTTMVARLPFADTVSVVNRPSDSGGRERSVPTTLQVVTTEPPMQITKPFLSVHDFNSLNGIQATAARATASISSASVQEPNRGDGALKLTYDYTQGETGTSAAYVRMNPVLPLRGNPLELGMWAYGDGREHWLRATILDGNGAAHTINFTNENGFNTRGWQYVRAAIPANIKGPIRLQQVYIAQANTTKQGKGHVYFDQLEAIYDSSYEVQRFRDVSDTFWARQAILTLNRDGIISGFDDGTFRPGQSITRAQTATMIARALNLPTSGGKTSLRDVDPNSVYYDSIAAVEKAGIMIGKTASTFEPNATLTRAEMASILQRAYNIQGVSSSPFPDVPSHHWAYSAIDALKAKGVASGMPDGTYGLNRSTTRAEFSVFLDRVK
ncbi:hypothetical protein BTR22_04935 [Alkalihalophilus pseudofirmus]|nr:hypothetical protein BTR22_04935 [Alkalihalophilus pseudofirmus]